MCPDVQRKFEVWIAVAVFERAGRLELSRLRPQFELNRYAMCKDEDSLEARSLERAGIEMIDQLWAIRQ